MCGRQSRQLAQGEGYLKGAQATAGIAQVEQDVDGNENDGGNIKDNHEVGLID